jgi:hypothetical protein
MWIVFGWDNAESQYQPFVAVGSVGQITCSDLATYQLIIQTGSSGKSVDNIAFAFYITAKGSGSILT